MTYQSQLRKGKEEEEGRNAFFYDLKLTYELIFLFI